jgi:hypothetical protein
MSYKNALVSSILLGTAAQLSVASAATSSSGFVEVPDTSAVSSATATTPSVPKDKIGSVGFESSSFFYKGKGRGTSSTTFEAEINGEFKGSAFKGKANAQLYTFVADHPEVGFESKELYISTNTGLLSGYGELSLGRRYVEWSKVDKAWDMMSLWSPRWTWDQLHPETIGMTGIFYNFDKDRFHFTFFGSPIAIPERGTATREENGNIVSSNPFWNPLPTEMTVLGTPTQLHYKLLTPAMQDILLRPNLAAKGLYEFENGMWVSASAGVLPVHIIQMAAEPYLDSSTTGDLNVNIRPQFPLRNIYTAELGYESAEKDWNLWLSTSYEQPFQFENQSTWLNPIITPTSIVSVGTSLQVTSNFRFEGSALFIHEQPFDRSSKLPDVNVELPSRFPLKQGFKVGGNWKFTEQTQSNVAWTQDLIEQNHFVSLDVQHVIRSVNIVVGGGADVFFNNSTKGWVGSYYGDDRLRGWLKYVF